MSKYLLHGSYTEEGLKGLLEEGGSKRRQAAEQVVQSVGGTVEAYYFAFGDNDFFLIADLPDNVSATALSLVGNSTGTINAKVTVLLTPADVDEATKRTVDFRGAGQ